ncbi:hypothetical protein [Meiothermus cerbereus]|uniref:hypothetical protein n=1 Tax=Meiothermus cerbereus TaxID=65552 RepID=UPI0012EBAAF2|nr:hypothetical protein [Meiothermus cerbereus]
MPIRTAFLRRPGVIGVVTKISTNRIQDPAKRERIIQFQRWAFETLDRLLFEEPYRAPEPQPLFPGLFRQHTKGDRALALAMLAGEVRAPDGRLYSYQAIERLSGVPRTTVIRLAHRHGWVRSQMNQHIIRPALRPQQPNSELLNLLAQQVQVLQRMLKSMAR